MRRLKLKEVANNLPKTCSQQVEKPGFKVAYPETDHLAPHERGSKVLFKKSNFQVFLVHVLHCLHLHNRS